MSSLNKLTSVVSMYGQDVKLAIKSLTIPTYRTVSMKSESLNA